MRSLFRKNSFALYMGALLVLYLTVFGFYVSSSKQSEIEKLRNDIARLEKDKAQRISSVLEEAREKTTEREREREKEREKEKEKEAEATGKPGNREHSALAKENELLKEKLLELENGLEDKKEENALAAAVDGANNNNDPESKQPETRTKSHSTSSSRTSMKLGAYEPVKDEWDDETAEQRRNAVKAAFKHAWDGYRKYAWGTDELRPVSRRGHNWLGQGGTIIDSMDTLIIMGFDEDYKAARDWVVNELRFDNKGDVSFFETTIRVLGGILAAYDLSGREDAALLAKAKDIGDRLAKAFATGTGLPFAQVNLRSGRASPPGWTGGASILAEVATVQLEFYELAHETGETKYYDIARKVMDFLEPRSQDGLYPIFIDPHGGRFTSNQITYGAMGDSAYEYFLKLWVQSGKSEDLYKRMYYRSVEGMHKHLVQKSSPSNLVYIADMRGRSLHHKMDHLACFAGGMLALGAEDSPSKEKDLEVARGIAKTCVEMYKRQASGLAPEYIVRSF